MTSTRTIASRLLCLVLGAWLGGSALVFAAAIYNFTGFEEMFARNEKLAARAGFSPGDENAKKSSLLWVHASELNRVLFERWGLAQMGIGAVAILIALAGRQGGGLLVVLLLALGLVIAGHFVLMPKIVEVGRSLDFVSRDPPPPQLSTFQTLHGRSLMLDLARAGAVALAAILAVRGPRRRDDA